MEETREESPSEVKQAAEERISASTENPTTTIEPAAEKQSTQDGGSVPLPEIATGDAESPQAVNPIPPAPLNNLSHPVIAVVRLGSSAHIFITDSPFIG